MSGLEEWAKAAVKALVAHPDVEEHRPSALSFVALWGLLESRLFAFRYDTAGHAVPLAPTAALTAALTAAAPDAGAASDPAGPVRGMVARVTPGRSLISLLVADAVDPWWAATLEEVAAMAHPDPATEPGTGPALPRESLDAVVASVLAEPVLEGMLLESVTLVARRGPDGALSWFAFAYPAGERPYLWVPAGDLEPDVASLFAAAARDDDQGEGPRVVVLRLNVHAEEAEVSLLFGPSADVWFPDPGTEESLAGLAAEPGAGSAAGVYESNGPQRWLRPEVVATLVGALFGSASEGSGEASAVAVVALTGVEGDGIDFAAFRYDEKHQPSAVVPRLSFLETLAAVFNENPGLQGMLVRADAATDRVEAVLMYGAEVEVWRSARSDTGLLADLARPPGAEERAVVEVLVEALGTDGFGAADGVRVFALATPGAWLVCPFRAWSAGLREGWVVAGGDRVALVRPGVDPESVAEELLR